MTRTTRITACCSASLLVLATACSDPIAPSADLSASAGLSEAAAAARDGGMVTTPFRAQFFTDQAFIGPDTDMCDLPRVFVIQEGYGEATHLGRFDIRITFCLDPSDLADGMLEEGESLPYDEGVGVLTAANGDQLGIAIAGAVVPTDEPGYVFEFSDPFSFTGGTGRFAGAAGGGITNSFVDNTVVPTRTTHVWTGTLSLPR